MIKTLPTEATHVTQDNIFYKKMVTGSKTWWSVWQQGAWWVTSGEPSEIVFPIKRNQ